MTSTMKMVLFSLGWVLLLLQAARGAALHEHHDGARSLKSRAQEIHQRLSDLEGSSERGTTAFKASVRRLQEEVAALDSDWHLCLKIADEHDEKSRIAHTHREKHKLNTQLAQNGERVNHHSKFKRLAEYHAERLHAAELEFSRVGSARAFCDDGLLTLDDVRGRLLVLSEEVGAHDGDL